MTANYYDVAVLGTSIGSLLSAALLTKRGFRVLVVPHDESADSYSVGETVFPRAPYTFLAAQSPVVRRVFAELALNQTFRRHATVEDPILQIAIPKHRIDVPVDESELEIEIEREFPEVRRPIEDFHRQSLSISAELDRVVERDLVWPPETFFERREFARATSDLPFDREGGGLDPLHELPDGHPFRLAIELPIRFAEGLDPDHRTALRTCRLYAAWLQGAAALPQGAEGLRGMLIDKIRTYNGELCEGERVERLDVQRGAVSGVHLAHAGERVGCAFVLCGLDIGMLARLLPERDPIERLFETTGEPQPRYYRYTLNVLVRSEVVPAGMGREVFFLRNDSRPLSGENALRVQVFPKNGAKQQVLCIEALLPARAIEDPAYLATARERTLESLSSLVPFLDRHLLLIDSPHDGRDPLDAVRQETVPARDPWTRGPQTMPIVYGYPALRALGLSALPVRTTVKNLLLCGAQVVPGLGAEGSFLSAWSASRVVTKTDRRKEKMRRGMWNKAEI